MRKSAITNIQLQHDIEVVNGLPSYTKESSHGGNPFLFKQFKIRVPPQDASLARKLNLIETHGFQPL